VMEHWLKIAHWTFPTSSYIFYRSINVHRDIYTRGDTILFCFTLHCDVFPVLVKPRIPDRLWNPTNLLFNAQWMFFPQRIKRPGRDVYHLPPSSAEVKNEWSYTSTHTPRAPETRTVTTLPVLKGTKLRLICCNVHLNN